MSLLDDYLNPDIREIHIGKANQLGITWLWDALLGVWKPLFHDNITTLLISHKEDGGSWEQIWKCNYILSRLPPFLTRKLVTDKKSEIGFAENDSRVLALPSTKVAGAGFNASAIFCDEQDLHPEAEENAAFLSPTIDAGNAKSVSASTRNTAIAREQSYFMSRYLQIKQGLIPHAKAIFLGWRERPVRDEGITQDEWFETRVRPRYTDWQLDAHYPETEEQFLTEARKTRYFNKEGIDFIRRDCYEPLETDGTVRIWARPEVGKKYAAFCDPSNGSDPHAFGIIDTKTDRLVCVSHGKVNLEKVAELFDKYIRLYNNAFNEFELNGSGGDRIAQLLFDMRTPNRRITGVSKDRKNKYGWWTGERNRKLMLETLREAVENKRLRIHYAGIPNELEFMTRADGEEPAVPRGKHDDLILMLGGLLQIKRGQPAGTTGEFSSGYCVGFER